MGGTWIGQDRGKQIFCWDDLLTSYHHLSTLEHEVQSRNLTQEPAAAPGISLGCPEVRLHAGVAGCSSFIAPRRSQCGIAEPFESMWAMKAGGSCSVGHGTFCRWRFYATSGLCHDIHSNKILKWLKPGDGFFPLHIPPSQLCKMKRSPACSEMSLGSIKP